MHGLVFICLVLVLHDEWPCLHDEWPCMVLKFALPKVHDEWSFSLTLHGKHDEYPCMVLNLSSHKCLHGSFVS